MTETLDPVAEVKQGWIEGLTLPPELAVSTWADEYRMLSAEASSEPGRWRTDRTPYSREPMDVISDDEHQQIVLMWSSQLGKTELILNALGYYMHYDPAPMLMVQPTEQFAQVFQTDRFDTMVRDMPVLADRMKGGPNKRGGGYKNGEVHFLGGHVAFVGANAPAGLAGRCHRCPGSAVAVVPAGLSAVPTVRCSPGRRAGPASA